MSKRDKPFEVEKTFGLGVLLKLTKKNVQGVDISTTGSKFTSSLSLDEVNTAVDRTMKTHNIRLKIK
jgi:hypothetical protein